MSEMGEQPDIPIFSERLDELMAAMLKGEVPNAGRFCGYCYTPLAQKSAVCTHCAHSADDVPPVAKIPSDFFPLYQRMRRRESLIVNSFAFAGLTLGLLLFILIVAVAVYRFDASTWWLAGATAVLLIGGRIFAGILGGWIGDSIGYDYAHKRLVLEWLEFQQTRDADLGTQPASPASDAQAAPSISPRVHAR
ncbi:MAG: hypothetical protein M3P30_01610 [Chloroflexota bacterium]|nr:hypothetical protein [Chloroflexota bacterium]